MNVLHKVTWKAMRKNRARTIVTAVGIFLSTALFCIVTTMGASMLSYLIDLQIAIGGEYHVSVTRVSEEEAEKICAERDVASAAQAGILGVVNFYGHEMGPNSALIKACNARWFACMPGFDRIEGRLPQTGGELLIDEYLLHTMQAAGYAVSLGSEVTLPVTPAVEAMERGDPSAAVFSVRGTIVGILPAEYDVSLPHEQGDYSHIYTVQDESTPAPLYYDLFLQASSPRKALALAEAIGGTPNYSLLQYYGIAKTNEVTVLIAALMAAVIAIVLLATVSMVSNAFSVSVSQRTREFGLLSSVGATKKQIRGCIRFEAGLLCGIAVPMGLLCGYLSAGALLASTADTVESMLAASKAGVSIRAVADPVALLGAAAIAVAAVFLSAWIPALRASKITPIAAIRREAEYRPDRKLQKTTRKWYDPSAIRANMAKKYYRVNRRKYRPITLALGIGVVLLLSAAAVSSSLQYISASFDTENCDFHVFVLNGDSALLERIRSHESVADSVVYGNSAVYTVIPADYASAQRHEAFAQEGWEGQDVEDVWRSNAASVFYLEDEAFRAFLRERGVDPEPYFDRENPMAAVLYQKWEYVGEDDDGYGWLAVTFPPFHDGVTALSYITETPNVEDYVAAQIRAQGYAEAMAGGSECDILPDGRLVYRAYACGGTIVRHDSGVGEFVEKGPMQTFSFLASAEFDDENRPVTRYYTYDEASGAVGSTAIASCDGHTGSIRLGAQLDGIPFGIPRSAGSALQLTLLRPLSMLEDTQSLPTLAVRADNYPACKNYLDTLTGTGGTLVYNDYLAQQYQTRQIADLIEVFALSFVAVMTLISVTNIFNIVSTNVLLRRRDIGMLRSMGMTARDIAVITAREYLSCGLRSLRWSLPVGVMLMAGVKLLLQNLANGGLQLPWQAIPIANAGIFTVVGSSVLYALLRIRRDDPIEAIRTESI